MRLGIDFGTTNSSIAYFDGATLSRLELDSANDNTQVLPSLIYINREQKAVVGTTAASEYLARETGRTVNWMKRRVGEIEVVAAGVNFMQDVHVMVDTAAQGRLLQYVKTALRDPSYEGTQIFDRFYTVDELIAIILTALKTRAERALGQTSDQVVIGRPVRFSDDPVVAERAEEILFKAARLAGLRDIRFEFEPIGAMYYYHRSATQPQRAFIFDFGGGTLDLTVAEVGGNRAPKILATHGVLVGGDDLDRRIMQSLRKYFGGAGKHPVPDYVLELLDNWQTMPILSRPTYVKLFEELRGAGAEARGIAALRALVTRNLGFTLFREIEQAKKRLSDKPITPLEFVRDQVAIHETMTRADFESLIQREIEQVTEGVKNTLDQAGLNAAGIDIVLRTGGTSAVPAFTRLLAGMFGAEKLAEMDLLTSVVGGLAIVAHEGGGKVPVYGLRYAAGEDSIFANINVASGRGFEKYTMRIGARCYADNDYTLTRIPVELSGLPALRLAQADKSESSVEFLRFDLARDARIFVAYDAEVKHLPDWLKSFTERKTQIEVDQFGTPRFMRLCVREFPAGRVQLGGNRAAGQRGEPFMNYLVAIQARL